MSVKSKKTLKTWLQGLIAAALGGCVMVIIDADSIVDNPKHSAKLALGGAVIGAFGYLKKSPLTEVLASEDEDTE
jgi:hypothetical protein